MILEAEKGREVQAARRTVIKTQDEAARLLGKSHVWYNRKEQDQEGFTVRDLRIIYDALGADSKDTIAAWLHGIFGGETLENAK